MLMPLDAAKRRILEAVLVGHAAAEALGARVLSAGSATTTDA